jgi:hypothetical protein
MNIEVLLPTTIAYSPILSSNMAKIPPTLYQSYDNNDLRKTAFSEQMPVDKSCLKETIRGHHSVHPYWLKMSCI